MVLLRSYLINSDTDLHSSKNLMHQFIRNLNSAKNSSQYQESSGCGFSCTLRKSFRLGFGLRRPRTISGQRIPITAPIIAEKGQMLVFQVRDVLRFQMRYILCWLCFWWVKCQIKWTDVVDFEENINIQCKASMVIVKAFSFFLLLLFLSYVSSSSINTFK